jgi:hypothetical protein
VTTLDDGEIETLCMLHEHTIRELIDGVRRRWRTLQALRAIVRAALTAALVLAVAEMLALGTHGAPRALAAVAVIALVGATAAVLLGLWPLRRVPGDRQVARFIEEQTPSLDDHLVSAVDVSRSPSKAALAELMLSDAAKRAREIEPHRIVPAEALRRAGFRAAASVLVFAAVLAVGWSTARQAVDAVWLTAFPDRLTLQVTPGHARIKAGTAFAVQARLIGNRAPVIAQVQIADGGGWRGREMTTDRPGAFRLALDSVTASFKYRVVAGAVTSPTFDVTVTRPPRVTRIDVDYDYPEGLKLQPRSEQDAGDIYAPAGTNVRVHVFTDRPAAGRMALGHGNSIPFAPDKPTELIAALKVVEDNSYRVALADGEGVTNDGDTEYFIRTLEDRPPEVRILKPASDRSVTRLEEVDIDAQAEDDYGVDRLDLVYSIRGDKEQVVPLKIPRENTTVNGHHTLFLEELEIKPGDFISYYVRARDITRGTRPNEARSDIFFLEVKPFEQEFALAQSSSMAGAGASGSIDDLVAAQKEVVVATWKLDRRTQSAKGAKSEQDIRTVGKAESELKTRVEQTSSTFRESTMRDPRKRSGQRGRGEPAPPRAGETLPEEDHMTVAAEAMGRAVASLDALKTGPALAPELEALDRLLKAQADVKRREVTRQQAGNGGGQNNRNYDVSGLFDKELQRQQQTNYETKSTAEQRQDRNESALDKIRDLARRQDELLKRQADLARNRKSMSEEDLKRELEKLTREQSELRQKAEDLARQMNGRQQDEAGRQSQQNAKNGQSGQQSSSGQQGESGQQGQSGQEGQSGRSGRQGQSGQQGETGDDSGRRMRDASDQMRNAAGELRRQDPTQASASAKRALEQLRAIERQMQSSRPDDQRRALGDLQLEARQLADAQRQVASELAKSERGDDAKDTARRLAGEQERLADRTRRMQEALKQQAGAKPSGAARAPGAGAESDAARARAAAGDAARDLDRQHLADRMQQSADAMRAAADRAAGTQRGNTAPGAQSREAQIQTSGQDAMARELDKVADKLASARGGNDSESRKLSDQLARVQEQRDRLDTASRELGKAGQPNAASGSQQGNSARKSPGQTGKPGEGQGGGGGSGTDLARLRDEYLRGLQETRDLLNQLQRDDQSFSQGGAGFTFEGRGMTMSAPGTEAFKQDFAKWEDLKRQATQALDRAESTLSKKLQAKQARDRLAAGADDTAPPAYRKQVDSYFKAIAGKQRP